MLPLVLAEQADIRPDAPWIITVDGERWTFGEAHADVRTVAGHFAGLGVNAGDRVIVMLPNGTDFVRAWLGLLSIGAVAVLLNTELRGAFLRHQLHNAGATLAVVDETLLPALEAVSAEVPGLRTVLVVGTRAAAPPAMSLRRLPWDAWRGARTP